MMSLTHTEIVWVVEELSETIGGSLVNKIWDAGDRTLCLSLWRPGESRKLLVSVDRGVCRLHEVRSRPTAPASPSGFVQLLRARLTGGRLVGITASADDRIVRIQLVKNDRLDAGIDEDSPNSPRLSAQSGCDFEGIRTDSARLMRCDNMRAVGGTARIFELIIELFDRQGNIILTESTRQSEANTADSSRATILGTLSSPPSWRQLAIGSPYESPPPPRVLTRTDLHEFPRGVGPQAPRIVESLATSRHQRPQNRFVGEGGEVCRSHIIEQYFAHHLECDQLHRAQNEARKRIRASLKKLTRTIDAIEQDLEKTQTAETLKQQAELLKGVPKRPRGRHSSIAVVNYFDEELPTIEIPLRPDLDFNSNIEKLFHKAKRQLRGREIMKQRLTSLRETEGRLQEALDSLDAVTGAEQVELIMEGLIEQHLLRRRTVSRQTSRTTPRAEPFKRFQSSSGRLIMVGKGAKENDELTFRIANGSDAWLHALGMGGAHVVVRLNRGESIDQASLLDAATLAAFYSKARGSETAEVIYTQRKFVRKPKGARPGAVTASGGKTLFVQIQEERLNRLLQEAWTAESR